jgi:hypothetical protein
MTGWVQEAIFVSVGLAVKVPPEVRATGSPLQKILFPGLAVPV